MSQSRENLRTDRRMDGQTLFYRTIPAEAGTPATSLQQVTGGNTLNLNRIFSKNSTTQEIITILRPKSDSKTYTKKKTSNQKLNL